MTANDLSRITDCIGSCVSPLTSPPLDFLARGVRARLGTTGGDLGGGDSEIGWHDVDILRDNVTICVSRV